MDKNKMKLEFDSLSQNESFARVAVAAFISQLDPTIEELTDVKTAVSEAVTNSIIHGYERKCGQITIEVTILKNEAMISILDRGKGIKDIEQAMKPLYTSRPDLERSGMGFTVMESFMDELEVVSNIESGTTIKMKKIFKSVEIEGEN